MIIFYSVLFGLIGSLSVSFLAYLAQALTKSGALVMTLVGTIVFALGPPALWLLLILFFGSSLVINQLKKRFNKRDDQQIVAKGATRDYKQVLANSLPLLLASGFYFSQPSNRWLLVCASLIAATTADTWASEIGVLAKTSPRDLLTGRKIPAGLSGGVSWLGTCASLAGSFLIAASFTFLYHWFTSLPLSRLFWLPLLAGFFAALLDSFLGASLQAKYRCRVCGQLTEHKIHHQEPTMLVSGLAWLDNDGVNLLTGLIILILTYLFN